MTAGAEGGQVGHAEEISNWLDQGCVRVASRTSNLLVSSFQDKSKRGVVERAASLREHAVDAVMAAQAALSKPGLVLAHKIGIMPGVALDAPLHFWLETARSRVAILTIQGGSLIIHGMLRQAEARAAVIEKRQSASKQIKIAPLVIGMAAGTILNGFKSAVRTAAGLDLRGNLHMAIQAQDILRHLQRLVAQAALLLKLSMRGVPAKRLAAPGGGRERPRAEGFPAAEPRPYP